MELGENLEFQYQKNVPIDPELSPLDYAFSATNDIFRTSDDLFTSASLFLATEIGFEPKIRQQLRSQFNVYAVINTRPTEEGKRVIDAFHFYRDVKHLRNKPVIEIMKYESPTTRFIKYVFIHFSLKEGNESVGRKEGKNCDGEVS